MFVGVEVESQYQPLRIGKNIVNFLVYILVMPDNDEHKPPAKWSCGKKGDDVDDDECKPLTKRSGDEKARAFILDNFNRKKQSR